MPEGPEVETIVRGLQQVVGCVITNVDSKDIKGLLKKGDESHLQSSLLSMSVSSVERVGKWILFKLSDPLSPTNKQCLLSHLGMFGTWLISHDKLAPSSAHTRLTLSLASRQGPLSLTYVDMRSWGRLYALTPAEAMGFLRGRVGVDATVVTLNQLRYFLRNYTKTVAEMLLDQSLVAGLGNIYRSEVLWHSQIAPDRPGTDITEDESEILWKAIRSVIAKAIELRGSSIRDYRDTNGDRGEFHKFLRAYGREGHMCSRCVAIDDAPGDLPNSPCPLIVSTKKFDDRSVFYCPSCQK